MLATAGLASPMLSQPISCWSLLKVVLVPSARGYHFAQKLKLESFLELRKVKTENVWT